MRNQAHKYKWTIIGSTNGMASKWQSRVEDGYQAVIQYVDGTGYTITITGTNAPSPTTWATRKLAKDAFRIFLLDQSATS